MPEESKKECTALVPVDKGELQRREVEEALKRGEMAEPISGTAILVSLAISAATTAASYLLSKALAPKPKPIRRGEFSGPLQIMQSEQGLMIPEIYGGDPGDGKGGSRIAPIIFWTSGIRKTVTVTRQQVGGGKMGGRQTQTIEEVSYDIDLALMWARGEQLLKKIWGNADVLYDVDGGRSTYEGESASSYTAPYQITDNTSASNGKEVTLQAGTTAAVQWDTVQSNGAATRTLTIWYANTGITSAELWVNGVLHSTLSLANSANVFKARSVDVALNNGANIIKIINKAPALNIRIDRIYCFPGHATTETTTGVLDPTDIGDPTYDPELPPDPQTPYLGTLTRFDRELVVDSTGVHVGTINHGAVSGLAIYPGNQIQLPDPTIQAAIDGEFGANSTPAYRGRSYSVHSAFGLSRWGGTVPNLTGVLENLLYKNLNSICGQWCARVGLLTGDYDFTALTSNCRGLFVAGRRYSPAEVMDSTIAQVFNCYFAEIDGQIKGLYHTGTSVVTIDDSEVGWMDDEPEDVLPEVDTILADEIKLPRRVDVKFFDPDQDFEANDQGEARQVTDVEQSEILDVQVTLTAQEARDVAQRTLYETYIRGTRHRFTLSWKYLYLNPGEVITITRDEGFTHVIQLTQISGGISILQCEGVAVESALYTQSTVPDGGSGFELPPVPIPQMTIAALMDTPLLRDRDETENNGIGFYAAATPRTGDGVWAGASLYVLKVGWERIADFTLPATMGRQVLANGAGVALPTGSVYVFDNTNTVTVDLYGTTQTLSSASEADVLNGQNACLIGDEVIQFTTATQVGGQPNRWTLSGLLRGRRGTEYATTTHVLNERFVFLNEAVKFIPMNAFDLNRAQDYRMVSNGQSLDDTATIEDFTWTGKTTQPLATIDHAAAFDSAGSALIRYNHRTRVGGGLRSYQVGGLHEETEESRVQILNGGSTTLPNGKERIMPVYVGTPMAALLESDASTKFTQISGNSLINDLTEFDDVNAVSFQTIEITGNSIEGFLDTGSAAGVACLGVIPAVASWRKLSEAELRAGAHIFITYSTTALTVYEYGVIKYQLVSPGSVGFRVRIAFAGKETRVYSNWTGSAGELVYSSPKEQTFPYRVIARVSWEEAYVRNIVMTIRPYPATIYSRAQQDEDFPSGLPDPIQADIWAVSKTVGPGVKTRVSFPRT